MIPHVTCVPRTNVARAYLFAILEKNAHYHRVSACVLPYIRTVALTFYVDAFREMSRAELEDFAHAFGNKGEAHRAGWDPVGVLLDHAQAFFHRHGSGTILLEHPFAKRGHTWLENVSFHVGFLGDEVYFVVRPHDLGSVGCEDAFLRTMGDKGGVAYFLTDDCSIPENRSDFPDDLPSTVCKHLHLVVAEVYDGEGLLYVEVRNRPGC